MAFVTTVGVAMIETDRLSGDYPPLPAMPGSFFSPAAGIDVVASLLRLSLIHI